MGPDLGSESFLAGVARKCASRKWPSCLGGGRFRRVRPEWGGQVGQVRDGLLAGVVRDELGTESVALYRIR